MTATRLSSDEVIAQLDATADITKLRERIGAWLSQVDPELRDSLTWALSGTPKHFRPLTLFACDRAAHATPSADAVELAFAVELMHNMSLIVDDVLDASEERRGIATVQHRYGELPALMASGYLVADAFDAFAGDAFAVRHLSELLRRLGAAECLQWRLRRRPLGVADWQRIAGEDTGLDVRDLRRARRSLAAAAPVRPLPRRALPRLRRRRRPARPGGAGRGRRGGHPRRHPHPARGAGDPRPARSASCSGSTTTIPNAWRTLAEACRAQLDEAETVLDRIADSARAEAEQFARRPEPLLALVDQVRQLSRR